jgi:hypothetical protein
MKVLQENGQYRELDLKEAEWFYLDYVNNFQTVEGFAGFYGFDPSSTKKFLNYVRRLREKALSQTF